MTARLRLTLLLFGAATTLSALSSKPGMPSPQADPLQAKSMSRPSISLYVEPQFKGRVTRVKVPVEIPNAEALQKLGIPNDSLLSIKIPAGVEVTLYDNGNYLGESLTLKAGDHPDLGRLNHRVSSLKAVETAP